jgi:hypothetical protein
MGGDFAIKADPQFKDRRKHDFYPAQQSPVINRGWKEAPFGKSPNLGALEK